ncbi:MAG: BLUF domain-containing protein [Myxococcota bacterium]
MYRILYASSASETLGGQNGVDKILEVSRRNNAKNDITGMLMFKGGVFVQMLEGPEGPVRETYARISEDPRHDNPFVLYEGVTENRFFPNFAMGYQRLNALDIRVVSEVMAWDRLLIDHDSLDRNMLDKLFDRFKDV